MSIKAISYRTIPLNSFSPKSQISMHNSPLLDSLIWKNFAKYSEPLPTILSKLSAFLQYLPQKGLLWSPKINTSREEEGYCKLLSKFHCDDY